MRNTVILSALAAAIAFVSPTSANDRYHTKPPVILSPDLAAPWVMQLNGGQARAQAPQAQRQVTRRYAVTPQKPRKYRQASVKPVQKKKATKPQIASQFLPQVVAYNSSEKAGTIIIDTQSRFLYLVMGDGKARRYGVGVGKAGFEWTGSEKITQKKEWPSWRPPAEMIAREKKKGRHLPTFMEGGPQNPLGARALYLGSTLYRIHGTNQPWTIGQAVSSGCIRMRNQDVVDLYERARVGAKVRVI
ncbi:MAG: L,D-transpeptidase [Lentilitoribacter sp.]